MEFHDQLVASVPRQGCLPLSGQTFANSYAAMLLQKHGFSADPLSANSRSGSPYMGPQADANNVTGALDAQAMQLPPAAKPLAPPPAAPFAAAMHALQQGTAAGRSQQQQHTGEFNECFVPFLKLVCLGEAGFEVCNISLCFVHRWHCSRSQLCSGAVGLVQSSCIITGQLWRLFLVWC